MWRRTGVVVVWILATIGTASVTLAAVTRVGGEVANRPAVPVAADDLVLASTIAPTSAGTTSTTDQGVTTTAVDWVTLDSTTSSSISTEAPSSEAPAQSSTAPAAGASSPPATSAPSTTTPAVQPPVTTVLIGGTVTVQQAGNTVTLISAVPASGFTADVEAAGPNEIQVEFKAPGHESKYAARVEGGRLAISTEEGDDD